MDTLFNEYMTEDERILAIGDAIFESKVSRLFTMLEMVDLHQQQQLRDAEFKVFIESGTYDDYSYLIQEANAEAQQQKEGILSQILGAIQGVINSILGALRTVFNGGKSPIQDNAEVTLTPEDIQALSESDEIENSTGFVNAVMSGNFSQAIEIAKQNMPTIAAAAGVAGVAAVAANKYGAKMNGQQANTKMNALQQICANFNNAITNVQNKIKNGFKSEQEEKDAKTCVNILNKMATSGKNGLTKIASKFNLTSVLNMFKSDAESNAEEYAKQFGGTPAKKGNVPKQAQTQSMDAQEYANMVQGQGNSAPAPIYPGVKESTDSTEITGEVVTESADEEISVTESIFGSLEGLREESAREKDEIDTLIKSLDDLI